MAETGEDLTQYLDPRALSRLDNMELRARKVVEGFMAGLHRSPYRGFSVEFAQHREYVPGDDLRHLDWKVFGRSDRLHIKEYEVETNLTCHLLLDTSESMLYGGERSGVTKLEYALYLAASIAWMSLQQRDAVGMGMFDESLYNTVPAKSSQIHLKLLLDAMNNVSAERKTGMGPILQQYSAKVGRRGMVVIISDLFDDPDHVLHGIHALGHRRHDVVVFHVLDPDELDLPFERMTLFDGLEEYPELLADPRSLREAYVDEVTRFNRKLRKGCMQEHVDYRRITTDTRLDVALSAFVGHRMKARK